MSVFPWKREVSCLYITQFLLLRYASRS
jgi:hypothetical protein